MSKNLTLSLSCLALTAFAAMPSRAAPISANGPAASASAELAEGFRNPPESSRLHAYWWWLNGNVTTEAITRDLESMKEKGFGGALIFDAGGANQQGNLRPNFDHALCEGLNQLVWTLITCSPPEMGMPGQELFAGTHFNPNCTWWRQSEGFLIYINRCQWLLRQGNFVADVLYYYGDQAPNFAGLRKSNPAHLPSGHDYDVASEDVLLHRVAIKDGRIVLPDGMTQETH